MTDKYNETKQRLAIMGQRLIDAETIEREIKVELAHLQKLENDLIEQCGQETVTAWDATQ